MLALALVLALALTLAPGATQQAVAAGERVDVWLTTTSDTGGRNVTRGLAPQTPVHFGPAGGGADQTITVDETTTYQQFEEAAPRSPTPPPIYCAAAPSVPRPATR